MTSASKSVDAVSLVIAHPIIHLCVSELFHNSHEIAVQFAVILFLQTKLLVKRITSPGPSPVHRDPSLHAWYRDLSSPKSKPSPCSDQ